MSGETEAPLAPLVNTFAKMDRWPFEADGWWFLARAVADLGPRICAEWSGDETTAMLLDPITSPDDLRVTQLRAMYDPDYHPAQETQPLHLGAAQAIAEQLNQEAAPRLARLREVQDRLTKAIAGGALPIYGSNGHGEPKLTDKEKWWSKGAAYFRNDCLRQNDHDCEWFFVKEREYQRWLRKVGLAPLEVSAEPVALPVVSDEPGWWVGRGEKQKSWINRPEVVAELLRRLGGAEPTRKPVGDALLAMAQECGTRPKDDCASWDAKSLSNSYFS
jgi:hypothetical protein